MTGANIADSGNAMEAVGESVQSAARASCKIFAYKFRIIHCKIADILLA